jgi:hypothetical protein
LVRCVGTRMRRTNIHRMLALSFIRMIGDGVPTNTIAGGNTRAAATGAAIVGPIGKLAH